MLSMVLLFVIARGEGEDLTLRRAPALAVLRRRSHSCSCMLPLAHSCDLQLQCILAFHRLAKASRLRWYSAASSERFTQLTDGCGEQPDHRRAWRRSSSTVVAERSAAYGLWKRKVAWLAGRVAVSFARSLPRSSPGFRCSPSIEWIFRFLRVQLGMHTVILAHMFRFSTRVCCHRRHRAASHGGRQRWKKRPSILGANEWQVVPAT